ncbi:MAG: hypothetical protein H0U70_04455 [Tatlockia sp.]|nr:hypothetical protein [Tatlockia sp.]
MLISEVFSALVRANLIINKKLNENPDYVERGLNSEVLNTIIDDARLILKKEFSIPLSMMQG